MSAAVAVCAEHDRRSTLSRTADRGRGVHELRRRVPAVAANRRRRFRSEPPHIRSVAGSDVSLGALKMQAVNAATAEPRAPAAGCASRRLLRGGLSDGRTRGHRAEGCRPMKPQLLAAIVQFPPATTTAASGLLRGRLRATLATPAAQASGPFQKSQTFRKTIYSSSCIM